ncbi:hypothetical protein OYT1_ch0444 [Ferriphaselus amnicola]|uniref:Uncharacterized protein n=1 Tax=Ferriphaselus amnicola TaxID=1188319 RepID=A0A2Z6G973_9PROT|nr:hypothetical protein [Ferriphaselus amnicola]BBE50017.1 hypothetical protein OYT1_ch0444 [Ferriphaselus amnicola]
MNKQKIVYLLNYLSDLKAFLFVFVMWVLGLGITAKLDIPAPVLAFKIVFIICFTAFLLRLFIQNGWGGRVMLLIFITFVILDLSKKAGLL